MCAGERLHAWWHEDECVLSSGSYGNWICAFWMVVGDIRDYLWEHRCVWLCFFLLMKCIGPAPEFMFDEYVQIHTSLLLKKSPGRVVWYQIRKCCHDARLVSMEVRKIVDHIAIPFPMHIQYLIKCYAEEELSNPHRGITQHIKHRAIQMALPLV